jgi:hypothetical protein
LTQVNNHADFGPDRFERWLKKALPSSSFRCDVNLFGEWPSIVLTAGISGLPNDLLR